MILYLTCDVRINMLDFLEMEQELPVKKLVGTFSLLSFVIKDMRHFAHARYLALDREAITESDEELIQALQSYQTIYDMRVVIIAEGLSSGSPFLQDLIQFGVLNIVTTTEIGEIQAELRECFSEDGMQRFKPDTLPQVSEVKPTTMLLEESIQYHFTCSNVKIAVAGCDRRVGVTTTAMNLVCWINAHGGKACYVEANTNNHLAHIIHLFEPEKMGNAYVLENNDFYMTRELNRNYNVIVLDCGVLTEQRLQDDFASANIRLLCGSSMPYELAGFYRAVERCKDLSIQPLGLFVPDDIRNYLTQTIDRNIIFADHSHELFDSQINGELYKMLLHNHLRGNSVD
ncbi:hypothetical protein NST83_20490 [Paenibacillus sp. FSL R10-2782]|uniref:hypothetical protein n=1 Tax=Paenibacillus sp. FSL R10-2782 TaxID=2954661 RepID=UPI0031581EF3